MRMTQIPPQWKLVSIYEARAVPVLMGKENKHSLQDEPLPLSFFVLQPQNFNAPPLQ